jgi:hypothetical protein
MNLSLQGDKKTAVKHTERTKISKLIYFKLKQSDIIFMSPILFHRFYIFHFILSSHINDSS